MQQALQRKIPRGQKVMSRIANAPSFPKPTVSHGWASSERGAPTGPCGAGDVRGAPCIRSVSCIVRLVDLGRHEKANMPIKIHGLDFSANVYPILGLCAEAGIDCEFVLVNLMEGAHLAPEFRKINPMHCIPTMVRCCARPCRAALCRDEPITVHLRRCGRS